MTRKATQDLTHGCIQNDMKWIIALWIFYNTGYKTVIPFTDSPVYETYVECKKELEKENKFKQRIKEAEEIEEIIRAIPVCIAVSYI